MYLIADGEVEIKLRVWALAISLVRLLCCAKLAVRPQSLLHCSSAYPAVDLHDLMDREPEFAARIEEAARAKLGRELEATTGDLANEEVAGALPPAYLDAFNPLRLPPDHLWVDI